MARRYVFADECGNFDFSGKTGASKYFILTTVCVDDCAAGDALLRLRRELAWEGIGLGTEFHATEDGQVVRDRVFAVLMTHDLRIDTTILEKTKVLPSMRLTDEGFYQAVWYLHMRYVAPKIAQPSDRLLVVSASLGPEKKRGHFHRAVEDVIRRVSPTLTFRVACWQATSDPCLQMADYCAWAIQRKWEKSDDRSYKLIADKVMSEFTPISFLQKNTAD
ncbi:MAG TPA: DUF3800 domain-containing protein [Gemmatimonadaceae bacterium]|nr:DUF3800 domain-containing protein [Gemmatimonadaceae bacterium]